MSLISTTTLSGALTTLSSIPQTFNNLVIIVSGMTANTGNKNLRGLPFGADDNCTYVFTAGGTTAQKSSTFLRLYGENNTLRTDANNVCLIQINNYTSTTAFKPVIFYSRYVPTAGGQEPIFAGGCIQNNAALTSFAFDYEGVNTFAGGTVQLFGVK